MAGGNKFDVEETGGGGQKSGPLTLAEHCCNGVHGFHGLHWKMSTCGRS